MANSVRRLLAASLLVGVTGAVGCGALIGIGEPTLGAGGDGGGAGGAGGGVGGVGGEAGGGGDGGALGGGPPTCDGCTGDPRWSLSFGTTNRTTTLAATMVSGDVVIAAATNGDVDFGGGMTTPSGDGLSLVLARIDSSGDYVWQRRFTGASAETPTAAATHPSGDIIVVGDFEETLVMDTLSLATAPGDTNAFVARISAADGAPVWLVQLSGMGAQRIRDVACSATGRISVIGDFDDELAADVTHNSLGDSDVFVAELGPDDGAVISSVVLASSAAESGYGIAYVGDDRVVTGDYVTTLDIGGTVLPNASQTEVFVARLGATSWATSLGGNNYQHGRALFVGDAQLSLAGSFQSELRYDDISLPADFQAQVFLAFSDLETGARRGALGLGEIANGDRAQDVVTGAVDDADNVVVASWLTGVANYGGEMLASREGSTDVLVSKLGRDGSHFWSQHFGAADEDEAHVVLTDGEETVVVGSFDGTIDFEVPHVCPAAECTFVVRLAR